MALLGSVDIAFTKSTQIANGAQQTATQAADTAGQAQATAQTASQTATQAADTAAGAAQAAQIAITTANGKNKAYYGATTPTSPQSGDIWFVEDSSGNVTAIKHYDGVQWVTDVDNAELAQQISAAQAAADNAAAVGQEAQQAANTAQQAATQAKTDAANAVTQANNAVDKANDATANAQSAIDKAQEGFDTAQDALSKAGTAENNAQSALSTASTAAQNAQDALTAAGNATDIANTAKQVASDAATAAGTAKENAQTALTNAQDAIDKANAANANANTREKSIVKSNAAPSNPATDQLWVDTSTTPQIMRRWNGTAWVDLSPTQASQIGAVSTTTYTTDISNINNTLSQKASVTTVNTLTGRVDKAETAISQNASDIALKADKTYVDTLKNTVDSHSTLISQNADAIALKASQSTVDALTGRVSTAEATLKTQADQIAARITKTDADAKYATQTALTATANSLTSNITAVQTNLDNLQVGGRNLLLGTVDSYRNVTVSQWTGTIAGRKHYSEYGLKAGDYITFGVDIKSNNGKTLVARIDFYSEANSDAGKTVFVSTDRVFPGSEGRSSVTVKLDETKPYIWLAIQNNSSATETTNTTEQYKGAKLEKGNKATDWTPAPEDMATVVQFNTLSQTLDSTTSRIGNAEGNISALQQTANSFATRISNAEDNISTLTQTAQGLQTAVSGKVDATTYNSFVTQTNSALQAKLSATDADAKYATQTALTATANSLTSNISAVQTNLDNLQVGGRNLAPFDKWQAWSGAPISKGSNTITLTSDGTTYYGIYHYEDSKYEPNTDYILTFKASLISGSISRMGGHSGMFDDSPSITKVYVDGNLVTGAVWTQGITISPSVGTTHAFEVHLRTKGDYSGETKGMFIQPNRGNFGSTYSMKFWDLKIEKGNKATDWTPAPEDMATQSQISQLVDDINLRVQKGDVINQINVSTEGILIDGKKVHITGQTTIDNAVIKDAMIQSMTANKLTAGTIDANVITVKNINASNIVTGTLDASKATVTNIDASKITTGTLNAARIAAGSIDASKLNVTSLSAISANIGNVTAGNISGVNIYGGSFTQSSSGQNIWIDQNGFHMKSNQLDVWMNGDHGLEILYNGESKFKVDTNGNLVTNNGTFSGNIISAYDSTYGISGSQIFSGGFYTAYSSSSGFSITGEYDNGSITIKKYPMNIPVNKSSIFETIIENSEKNNYETEISAGKIKLYALPTPGDYLSAKTFSVETEQDKTTIYSSNDTTVSAYGNLRLENSLSGNIYLTPLEKVYLEGTLNIGNNIDLSWNSSKNSLEFSKGIKSGNILINENTMQVNNIVLNGAHSIISNDGGQLYFTDNGGNRIDITVRQVHADQWVMPNNMQIGYHTIQTNDNGDLWFTGADGNLISIHIKSWASSSKYDLKENFEKISPEDALQKILRTDVVSWNFKGETEKHIGPIIGGGYSMDTSFIAENGEEKKSDDIVGALMLSTKALVNYHQELVLKIADLEARLAKLEA